MNLQRLPENFVRWGVTLFGILLALFLARKAGDSQMGFVVGILLMLVGIGVVLAVREKIWVLIPIAWGLVGQIPSLGLPFSARDLVVLFIFVSFLMLTAFKVVRSRQKFGVLDTLAIIMMLYLLASWIRNPVGVDALGSERVGGRPYLNCIIGALSYWVLSRVSVRAGSANRLAIAMAGGRMVEGVLAQFLAWFPLLSGFISAYYVSGIFTLAEGLNSAPIPGAESTERLGYLVGIGQPLLQYLFARHRLDSLLNPLRPWWPLLITGALCVLFSGFRSALFLCLGYLVLSGYFYRGSIEVMRIGLILFCALVIMAIGNGTLFNLPLSAQRALSWLPGQWDEYAVLEAKASTKWRTDMWVLMLTTDHYITNKYLGDGFGFDKREMATMEYFARTGDNLAGQESFMITGSVHSGPVSSIRYGGYIGLALLLTFLVAQAREAWSLIRRAFSTPFRILALFVCVPIVIEPVFFTLIFGAYENAIPESLYNLGMLRMLGNSLAKYDLSIKTPAVIAASGSASEHNFGELVRV